MFKKMVFTRMAVSLLAAVAAAQQKPVPLAPAPTGAVAQPQPKTASITFPAVNPANFTATSPTAEDVNAFLKSMWGYDENRIWSVAAILSTPAPGVAKIAVYVADKNQPSKATTTVFFTTPDGKHVIADNVMPFGSKPFAETRMTLQAHADGPARGASSTELLLVEFGDLQCPRCRDAQTIIENLSQDFPQARIVFENLPLAEVHPFAFRAATEGVCVRKAKGDAAFFKYAQLVYDSQAGLTPEQVDTTLNNAAAKAGADPAAAATCSQSEAAKESVNASVMLAHELGIGETPVLTVNGRILPLAALSYETLKHIIVYQANQDGVPLVLQPSLRTLK